MNIREWTALGCERLRPVAHVGLRVAAGVAFFSHGSQKLFGWFGGVDGAGGAADLVSRFGAAGMIETVAGCLIVLGLFTRPAAVIASGQMAVAYLWIHFGGDQIWWWRNGGELAMLYAFIWLWLAAFGAGPASLDRFWSARKGSRVEPAPG